MCVCVCGEEKTASSWKVRCCVFDLLLAMPVFVLLKSAVACLALHVAALGDEGGRVLTIAVVAAVASFSFFDMAYVISCFYYWTVSLMSSRVPFSSAVSVNMVVWPSDVDWWNHMNNARYNRKLEWARVNFFIRTGVGRAMRELGAKWGLAGVALRFRRELRPFASFTIVSKYAGCDDATRSVYIEHCIETRDAGGKRFVHAHAISRMVFNRGQHLLPSDLAKHLNCDDCRGELSPVVEALANFDTASSAKLREKGS